jgi:gliding motility-associated-like protein
VLVLLLLSLSISAQITTIWLEDFSGVPDTETIDDGSYTPLNTAWSVDNSACTINGGDYSWIISNEFRAGDNDGEAVWTNTGTIDISGYSNANITVDLFENGNNSGDYVEVYYRLDGGPEIQLTNGNQTGNFTSVVASVYGLSGSTLQIVVRINHSSGNKENYFGFDNIHVFYEPAERYAINNNGFWNSGSTWSYTEDGPNCNCIPNAGSEVYTDGRNVIIDGDADAKDLTVDGGDITFNGSHMLTIHNNGTLLINSGSSIDIGVTSGELTFDNGTTFNLAVNDATTGLEIEEIYHDADAILTISGNGRVVVRDDITLRGDNSTIINNLGTTLTLDGTNLGGSPSNIVYNGTNNTFRNNTSISIFDGMWGGTSNSIFSNYGTVTQYGDFNNFGNLYIYNYSGAIWNWSGNDDDDVSLYANIDGANDFNYTLNGDQDIITPQDAYWHLNLYGSGTKQMQASFEVEGNLDIGEPTVILDINGQQLNIAGNCSNNGSSDLATGTIEFDGTGDQGISNNGGEEFSDIIINKPSGTLYLDDEVEVNNSIDFMQGLVNTNDHTLYLSNGTMPASWSYTSGQIIGRFERQITSTTPDYEFPVGTVTTENMFTVKTNSGLTSGSLVVWFTDSDPGGTGLPVTDGAQSVYHQFSEGYWSAQGNNSFACTNYNVELNANGFTSYTVGTATRVITRPNGSNWDDPVPGAHTGDASTTVYRNNITTRNLNIATAVEFGCGHPTCITTSIVTDPTSLTDQCLGSDILFGIEASGGGTLNYDWWKVGSPDTEVNDGGDISGAETDTLRIANIDATDAGSYYCVVDNICSSPATSATASLSIDDDVPVPTCAVAGDQAVGTNTGCTYVHPDNTWDGSATDNCSAPGNITITYNLYTATTATGLTTLNGQAFNQGTTWVRMIAVDEASNVDSCSFTVTVSDDDAPVPTCAVGNQTVGTNTGCTYVHSDNSWDGSATDNCSAAGNITITYNLYSATTATGLTTLNGQTFNQGVTWVRMIATDEAANVDSCSFTVTVNDDDVPVPACAVSGNQAVTTNTGCTYVHPDNTWDGSATDNCSAPGNITITYNLYTATTATGLTTLNGQAFNQGVTWVRMIATDEAANVDSCSFTVTVTDDDVPVPTCAVAGDQAVGTNTGCTYVHPDNTWDGSATDNCSAPGNITITYNLYTATTATGLTTLNGQAFNQGTTWVRMIAVDEASNVDSCSFTVTVSDDDAPVPTCAVGNQTVGTNTGCTYVHSDNSWDGSATDNCSAAGNITITYNLYSATTATGLTTLNGQTFNQGVTWVRMIATDEAANVDSCSFTVTVNDDDVPVPACAVSGNQAVTTNTGCTYVHPDNTWDGSATDNCSAPGNITITYNLYTATTATGLTTLNGQAFNQGVTWVRMIATDEAANVDSCSFTVTVTDDDVPVPTCAVAGDQAVGTNTGCTYVHPDNTWDGSATDNCSAPGNITITYNLYTATTATGLTTLNGQAFNQGVTWVRMIATDAAANVDSCSFTVTVSDDDNPIANAYPTLNLQISLATGIVVIDTIDIDNGSTDNCGIVSRSIDIDTFYCDDIGNVIPVTLIVWDASGNFSTDVTSVTITGYDIEPAIATVRVSDTNLCSGDRAEISLVSNADSTSYNWTITAHPDVTGDINNSSVNYPPGGDYTLNPQFFNSSDTARRVQIDITSTLFNLCAQTQFDTTFYFWVIPGLSVDLEPNADTICNNDTLDITIGSPSVFEGLRFRYEIIPDDPGSLEVIYRGDTSGLLKGHIIVDSLVNSSGIPQRAVLTATPYISGPGAGGSCSPTPDNTIIWVEPTISIAAVGDTICSDGFTNINIISTGGIPTRGIRYTWTVTDLSGGDITGWSDSLGIGQPIDKPIVQQLTNAWDDSTGVIYTITPYTIQADSSLQCAGESIDIKIIVNPEPKINVVSDVDTLCDNSTVTFNISTPNTWFSGNWVYDVDTTASNPGSVTGHTSGRNLTGNYIKTLTNLSDTVQWVDFTFHPKINNPTATIDSCDAGAAHDTTIRIWINPTPRIQVEVDPIIDTLLCDSASVTFNIDSLIAGTTGQWVYDIDTVSSAPGLLNGYRAGIGFTGDFTDQLINLTNSVQWVDYTFHPRINNPRSGLAECDNGTAWDTTIRIWVEPYPGLTLNPVNDTICSGDTTALQINSLTSSYYPVEFEYFTLPVNPAEVSVTNVSPTTRLTNGEYIVDDLVNLSDTAQVVNYKVVPYTVDGNGTKQCTGDTVFAEVIVEPALIATLIPDSDTICSEEPVNIKITSTSKSSQPLRFFYNIYPENPTEIDILYDTAFGTIALDTGRFIVDTLVNISDTAQLVRFDVTAYVQSGSDQGCPGVTTSAFVWVEPTPKVVPVPLIDTICDSTQTSIVLTSPTGSTRPVEFEYIIEPENAGDVVITPAPAVGLQKLDTIQHYIDNTSDTAQLVQFRIIPYTIDAAGFRHCDGDTVTADVWVEPTPVVSLQPVIDTICDSTEVEIVLTSPTGATRPVEFEYILEPENAGDVIIHPAVGTNGLQKLDTISHYIDNTSDTAQLVRFRVIPYTIDGFGFRRCDGDTVTTDVWVEPTPIAITQPLADTLCDSTEVRLVLTGPTGPTRPVLYEYSIVNTYPAEIIITPGAGAGGLSKYDTISHYIDNTGDTARLVQFIVTPYTIDAGGARHCDGPSSTTDVWVEPTPALTLNPVNDTLCSGDTTAIQISSISSPIYDVEFEYFTLPVNPAEVTVTNVSPTTRLTNGEYIVDQLVNLSDTAQVINYKVVPYTIDGAGTKRCTGDTVFAEVVLEPALVAILTPMMDTICSVEPVNIKITSTSKSSQPLRFFYNIYPENPTEIDILYDTAFGTIALDTGRFIVDTLVNLSDTAQLVRFDVTAYVQSGSDQGCPGVTTSAFVWVEPTPKVVPVPLIDTICDSTQTSIVLTSPTGSTRPVEFEYIIEPENAGDVVITPAPAVGLQKLDTIQHYIDNTSDTAQLVQFRIIPYTIDAAGFRHCDGDTVTADVWVEPTPVVNLQPVIDTICDSTEVEIVLTSPTGATRPVEFEYILEPENAGDVIIHPAVGTNGLQKLDTISHYIDNTSDTAQLVRFRVIPYTIDGFGFRRCDGDTVTTDVWVEPTPIAITQPLADTLCDSTEVRLVLTGPTGPTRPVLYEYSIVNTYPAEIVITPGAGAGGLSKYDTISHYIDNTGDTARLVQFIVTPYTIDAGGARHCDGPSSTTDVWVEPTPALTLNPVNDTLCSGDTTAIQISSISSPIYDVEFEYFTLPVNPAEVTVTNVSPTTRLTNGEYIVDQLVNLSDTAQVINYKVVPYTIDGAGTKRCTGDTVFAEVVLEPALVAILTPIADTLCNEQPMSIRITSTSRTSQPLRFRYTIEPANPGSVIVGYDTTYGTVALDTGRFIVDTLTNITDEAQLVRVTVTPYVQGAAEQGCPGVPTVAEIWVEPTIDITASSDTLCTEDFTNIVVSSTRVPTKGIRYTWTVSDISGGVVTGWSNSTGNGYPITRHLQQQLVNSSSDSASIVYTITPHAIRGDSSLRCAGIPIDVRVWVNPTPDIYVEAAPDTILCDSGLVTFTIDSLSLFGFAGDWVYTVNSVPSSGDISGYTNNAELTDGFTDELVNLSDTVQWVDYTFHPQILNSYSEIPYCGNTTVNDTTIRIYVNPTPRLFVNVTPDTLLCDSSFVSFEIDSLIRGTTGQWVYDIDTVSSAPGLLQGYTAGTDFTGNFSDQLINLTDTVQWVEYTFHPRINNPRTGLAECDNGTAWDTTIRIWVEPTPRLTLNPVNDTICSGDTTAIQISSISSPFYEVEFEYFTAPVNPAEVTVTNISSTTGLTNGEYIVDQLVNLSDTAQVVNYKVVPYTVDRLGVKHCTGDTVFAEVVVEPVLNAILTPIADTLCNEQPMSIRITSTSRTSQPLRFRYTVEPENPGSVIVGYDTIYGTVALDTGRFIVDTLTNITDEAQLVRVTVTPYVQGAAEQGCPGVPTVAEIWVEPTIDIAAESDTLCTEDFTNIVVSSTRVPTKGIRYTWTVSDISGGVVTGWSNSTGNGYPITRHLQQQLVNSSSDSASIVYTITPHAIRGDSSLRCAGIPIDVRVWVNPTPDIYVEAAPDTILCDSGLVTFTIDSLSLFGFAGDWVYTVNSVPSSGDISGYTNNAELTDGFTDELVNLSDTVQWVDYTFHPQILNSYSEIPYCGNTTVNDTTIRIYVNPTPRLFVNVTPDTLLCDSSFVSFEIDSLIRGTTGQWVYDIDTVSSAPGLLQGYTAGTDFTGNFSDQLINLTDTVQWVEYTFHPRINNPRTGLAECDNGTAWDTTIRIWVEPTPRLTLNPVNDTICSGDTTAIQISSISSPFYEVEFEYFTAPVNPAEVTVTNISSTTGLTNGEYIVDQLVNLSDTAQVVNYKVVPYTVDRLGVKHCTGDTVFAEVVVEPVLNAILTPIADTLCNEQPMSIRITSTSRTSQPLRFRYTVEPENPGSVIVGYDTIYGTVALDTGRFIVDTLTNITDEAQLVRVTVTPYVQGAAEQGCPGVPTVAEIWVEPTIDIAAESDTLCTEDFTNIVVSSTRVPTKGIRYTWTVSDISGGVVTGWSNSTGNGYPITRNLQQQLVNSSSDSASIVYTITPHAIRGDSSLRCAGIPIDVRVWVNPTPDIYVEAAPDTILCDSGSVTFTIDSLSLFGFAGDWVYTVNSVPSSGDINGYTNNAELTDGFTDELVNLSDTVQWVDYTFHPQILNSYSEIPYCGNTTVNDTTIRIYVNPTPRLFVTVTPDTLLCDSSFVSFEIDSLIRGTTGQWVYDIDTVSSAPGLLQGYTAGTDFTGNFSDQLINLTDTVQWVEYTFHPRINNPRTGLAECDNGTAWDTTIRIWVEPTPRLTLIPMFDTLCSGDTTAIQIISPTWPFYPAEFEYFTVPENPSEVTVTNISPTAGLLNEAYIIDQLVNLSDTAQVVTYKVVPYTVDRLGVKHCSGDTVYAEIIIEPLVRVSITPKFDTLCNDTRVYIDLNSVSQPSRPVRFRYTVDAPPAVTVIPGVNVNLSTTDFITDSLSNSSDTAQLVRFFITPYTRMAASDAERCSGVPDTAYIWLEPTAKVYFDHYQDTICNLLTFDSIFIQSVTQPTVDIRFNYEIIPDNPAQVSFVYNQPITNIYRNTRVSEVLENLSDTIQRVVVRISPYLIDGNDNTRCGGISDSVIIQLTPSLIMQDTARQYPRYQIQCFGDENGAFYLFPTGGILAFGPSNYDQRDVDFTLNGTNNWPYRDSTATYHTYDSLGAGVYTLGATDWSGCSVSKIDSLTQADTLFMVQILEKAPIKCKGVAEGIVYARKQGGAYYNIPTSSDTIGYSTTRWLRYGPFGLPVIDQDTVFNVFPGNFSIQVWDTNQCLATASRWIFGADAPDQEDFYLEDYNGFNVSCFGDSDGILYTRYSPFSDTISYGLYKYNGDTTLIDSVTISTADILEWPDLDAGNYLFKVESSLGCFRFDTITVRQPVAPLTIADYTLSSYHSGTWNVRCSDSSNGVIDLDSIIGGRPWSYTYSVSRDGSVFSNDSIISGLPGGDYKIVVDDGYCSDSTVITLTTPDSIYIEERIVDNNLCYADSTGRIQLNLAGGEGTPPYKFTWQHDTVLNAPVADKLVSGTYFVAVEDSIGCVLKDTITLVQPDSLAIYSDTSNYNGYGVSCFNGADGYIRISTSGGSGIKVYDWRHNEETLPNDSILNELGKGFYYLAMQDANGCSVKDTFELTEPEELIIVDFSKEDKVCSTPGIGRVSVTGGVPIEGSYYSYLWSNNETSDSTITLPVGEHWVEITDWNNCMVDTNFQIFYVSNIEIDVDTVKAISCFGGSDGILKIVPNDATLPFDSIKWNGVVYAPDDTILYDASAGIYIVEILDSKECFDADTFAFEQPDSIEALFTAFEPSCYGFDDGYVLLDAMGGNGIYQYALDDSTLDSDISEFLAAGTYKYNITDQKGCIGGDTITVTQPDELQVVEIMAERIPPACPDSPDGTMMVTAEGGTEPYTFRWYDNETTGNIISGIDQGYYGLSVTDFNGCFTNDTLFMEAELPACLIIPSAISPNGDDINDFWDIINPLNEDLDLTQIYPEMVVKIYNRWGQLIWESERGYPRYKAWRGTDQSGRPLPVDSYHYIIYLNHKSGRIHKGIITIVK